ncbi:MAG: TetR/AcrR family transcriptional regulator [Acidimicrobiia bacterium]|nr:TetR/AcrR family transcriptional regulator [Acidimicrobiia bacterium]MBV8984415.1 TetR/AcrR family transcriptional regulator [Acidimicrobiia bacterium]MBV9043272.1 TetR/AcrR family transcriptional regulator [Acidimicrobiia bacterium]
MAVVPRASGRTPETREALLNAAEAIMLEEGYAAVTTRRIAAKAGLNSALVFYYFDSMDGLFIALFRRGAQETQQSWDRVLKSAQPLWGVWDLLRDESHTARTMEFIALGNHRKAIRAEIATAAKRFHHMQRKALARALESYGVDAEQWPVSSVIVMLTGIARYLLIEEAFDVRLGHAETVALVEAEIRKLEGVRQPAEGGVVTAAAG